MSAKHVLRTCVCTLRIDKYMRMSLSTFGQKIDKDKRMFSKMKNTIFHQSTYACLYQPLNTCVCLYQLCQRTCVCIHQFLDTEKNLMNTYACTFPAKKVLSKTCVRISATAKPTVHTYVFRKSRNENRKYLQRYF